MKFSKAQRLEMAKRAIDQGIPSYQIIAETGIDHESLNYAIELYQRYGDEPFLDENKRVYTKEFKLQVIKEYKEGGGSMRTLAVKHCLPDSTVIRDWVRLYDAKGPDGLITTTTRKNYMLSEDRKAKIESEELRNRLEYLEAENEYLKKSYSLILERSKQQKKK